jgi:hypothetical protein
MDATIRNGSRVTSEPSGASWKAWRDADDAIADRIIDGAAHARAAADAMAGGSSSQHRAVPSPSTPTGRRQSGPPMPQAFQPASRRSAMPGIVVVEMPSWSECRPADQRFILVESRLARTARVREVARWSIERMAGVACIP